jgi:hypothetical protein
MARLSYVVIAGLDPAIHDEALRSLKVVMDHRVSHR